MPREREILASIEQQVSAEDPRLAKAFEGARTVAVGRRRFPVPVRYLLFLVALLAVLAVLGPYLVGFGPAALAGATVVLVVPWVVITATATRVTRRTPPQP